jgi:hypothetical protein
LYAVFSMVESLRLRRTARRDDPRSCAGRHVAAWCPLRANLPTICRAAAKQGRDGLRALVDVNADGPPAMSGNRQEELDALTSGSSRHAAHGPNVMLNTYRQSIKKKQDL